MPRPRTVYRGKRKYSWIITVLATVLVILVLIAIWLFYYLQRFIVYDKEGLRLDLSAQREEILHPADDEIPVATPKHVDVEIVVEEKKLNDVVTNAGNNLQTFHAVFVEAAKVNENTLKYYLSNMGDFDAVVLELKTDDGYLRYRSTIPLVNSYAVNGSLDLQPSVDSFKEKGIYLIAQISALSDSLMAQRNAPIALQNAATDSALTDGKGHFYLDPYSSATRSYLLALITELRDLGFDEVLLNDFYCPDSDYLKFSQSMTQDPDATSAIRSLGLWLREQADELGIKVSGILPRDCLYSEEVIGGQNPLLFFKAFDRVAVETPFEYLTADAETLEGILGGPTDTRIVAIAEDYTPSVSSYIIK